MRFWDRGYDLRRKRWADSSALVLMSGQMVSSASYCWHPMYGFAFVVAVAALVAGSFLGSLSGWANPFLGSSWMMRRVWFLLLGIGVLRGVFEVLGPWLLK